MQKINTKLYGLSLCLDQEHRHLSEFMDRDLVIPEGGLHRPLPRNNLKQQEAIDKALGSRFSLIQGPPGKYIHILHQVPFVPCNILPEKK